MSRRGGSARRLASAGAARIAATAGLAAALAGGACQRRADPGGAGGGAGGGGGGGGGASGRAAEARAACAALPFAVDTPLPEASGAAWLAIDGALRLVAIGDSGRRGAYAILDPETGATGETGRLPLGERGDDLEGLAARGGKLYAITSSGWIRTWTRAAGGFALEDGPYPIAPLEARGLACELAMTNCGPNYEGLCLLPDGVPPRGPCIGFAAAKRDGRLYCLEERGGRLAAAAIPPIEVARRGVLADCAFAEDGRLYTGANLLGLGQVLRVHGWEDPARARLAPVPANGLGSPEALAVRGDVFYRMSDSGGAPSMMGKYRCTEPERAGAGAAVGAPTAVRP